MKTKYIFFLLLLLGCKEDDFLPVIPTNVGLKSISVNDHLDTLVISKTHKIGITGTYTDGTTKDLTDSVVVSVNSDKIRKVDNQLLGVKSGIASYNISYKNFSIKDSSYVSEIEYVEVPELKPRSGTSIVVPVVVINYLPTVDGINLDMNRAPDNYFNLQNSTLVRAKNKIKTDLIITKYGIEEGSRYKDRGKNVTQTYVGVNVVRYINVYEVPMTNWYQDDRGITLKTVDNTVLFQKLKMKELFDLYGVKEIWFTVYPKDDYPSVINSKTNDPSTYYGLPESNMQTPDGKDIISNPYPHEITWTLPRYKNTYVFYGYSATRTAGDNLHNRGHQIECQMNHIESKFPKDINGVKLFGNKFVGWGLDGSRPKGRAGDTHHPPNALDAYQYNQTIPFDSDISDWKPNGGIKSSYSNSVPLGVKYNTPLINQYLIPSLDYNKDGQYTWLVYWFQTIPGLNNNIDYVRNGKSYKLSNWWDILYYWDESLKNNETLWVQ